jgi:CRP/FNR family transcriptional activator FtrB
VSVVGPGHSFIIAAVFLDRPYLKSARVIEPSKLLLVPADPLRKMARVDAQLACNIAHEMALAYRDMVRELKNQKLRSGIERLANWLIRRDLETGSKQSFKLPYDKKILAARLGMAPEVLSRTFAALEKHDVEVAGRDVRIHDREALLLVACPSPLIDDPTV